MTVAQHSQTQATPASELAGGAEEDNFEIVDTPSPTQTNSNGGDNGSSPAVALQSSSSGSRSRATWQRPSRAETQTPDYPAWLPRRPPPPAPPSTRATSAASGILGSTSYPAPPLPHAGKHRITASTGTADTAVSGWTDGEVGIGDTMAVPENGREGDEGELGRTQVPRSVRIVASESAVRKGTKRRKVRQAVGAGGSRHHTHDLDLPQVYGRGAAPPSARPFLHYPDRARPSLKVVPRFNVPLFQPSLLLPPPSTVRSLVLKALWAVWYRIGGYLWIEVVMIAWADLGVAWALIVLALHPTPASEGLALSNSSSSSQVSLNTVSSRNWTLAATGYVTCWLLWVFGVKVLWEGVRGGIRPWRSFNGRPAIMPLYLSAPGFAFACASSFANACFMWHVRLAALPPLINMLPSSIRKLIKSEGSNSSSASEEGRRDSTSTSAATRDQNGRRSEGADDASRPSAEAPPSLPSPLRTSYNQASLRRLPPSMTDFLAESFHYTSQTMPSITLILPRAALALALLLSYSLSQPLPLDIVLASSGSMRRDGTYFDELGQLNSYGRACAWTVLAWSAFKTIMLFSSWFGLWWLSGETGCGFCAPSSPQSDIAYAFPYKATPSRYNEKSGPNDDYLWEHHGDEDDRQEYVDVSATWCWRSCARRRLREVWELCLPSSSPIKSLSANEKSETPRADNGLGEDGLERVLAAAGLPSQPLPARRGVLRDELFDTPPTTYHELETDQLERLPVQRSLITRGTGGSRSTSKNGSRKGSRESGKESDSYVFRGYPAQASSTDAEMGLIPFPPSPTKLEHEDVQESDGEIVVDVELDEAEESYEHNASGSSHSQSARASASMSSLGQTIPSRFPFQFRQMPRQGTKGRRSTRGSRAAAGRESVGTVGTALTSASGGTDNISGSGSGSVRGINHPGNVSIGTMSSLGSPLSPASGSTSSPVASIPLPPSGVRQQHRRNRASLPTVPVSSLIAAGSLASEIPHHIYEGGAHPRVRPRSRTVSGLSAGRDNDTFGPHPMYESSDEDIGVASPGDEFDDSDDAGVDELGMLTDPEPEGSQEAAEREDSVGLLSSGPSPRSSRGALRGSISNLNISLTNLGLPPIAGARTRSRHSSASSTSYGKSLPGSGSRSTSNSGSHDGGESNGGRIRHQVSASALQRVRSRSLSARARSRTHSLIHAIGTANQSTSSFTFDSAGSSRSRVNSVAMEPVAEGVVSSSQLSANEERIRIDSGTSGEGSISSSSAGSYSNNRDDTFGQRIPLKVGTAGEEVRGSVEGRGDSAPSGEARVRDQIPPSDTSVPPNPSAIGGSLPIAIATPAQSSDRPLQGVRSFVSSAHDSLITGPATIEGSSDSPGRTPESYGTMRYDYTSGAPGSGWRPA